jgi:DNA repair exonuclease SbcCD ATPase subunit
MKTIAEYNQAITAQEARRSVLKDNLKATQAELVAIEADQAALGKAQVFLQTVAQRTQEQLRLHIEDIVQLALDSCWPDKYTFKVMFEIKRGQTEAAFQLISDTGPVDPLDEVGGGVVDVAAFALRIAAWSLGQTRAAILLDEPFRFLSQNLQPKAGAILRELSARLGLQFVMVTHNAAMIQAADRVFEVKMVDGISQVITKDNSPDESGL